MVRQFYTDGACRFQHEHGAWAYVYYEDYIKYISCSGHLENTTNNECELTAVVEVLKWIKYEMPVDTYEILSDSAYVINTINEKWYLNWIMNGSINDRPNSKLWLEFHKLFRELKHKKYNLKFKKVKGHTGVIGNEEADRLCNKELDNIYKK